MTLREICKLWVTQGKGPLPFSISPPFPLTSAPPFLSSDWSGSPLRWLSATLLCFSVELPFTGPVRVEGVAAHWADCHSGFNIQKCSQAACVRDSLDSSRHMNTSECHFTLGLTLCPGFLFVSPWPTVRPGSEYATYAASWANINPTVANRRPKVRSCRVGHLWNLLSLKGELGFIPAAPTRWRV